MSAPRDLRLTPRQLALKLATREAVEAAGGQAFAAGELGRAQSRISDYCSENAAEFIPLDLAEKLELLGAGSPGHPHITRALARARGLRVVAGEPAPEADSVADLGEWLASVARENADLARALADENLALGCERLSPAARGRIGREAGQLIAVLERLRAAVDGATPRVVGGTDTS